MKFKRSLFVAACLMLVGSVCLVGVALNSSGTEMTGHAVAFLASLDEQQRASALMEMKSPQRVQWHFIPKAERKGVQIKHLNAAQRKAAHALLAGAMSELGYKKATDIMELEAILHELEKDRPAGPTRDPERYYFTVFGEPRDEGRWGLSVEGHHLSLNFVVDGGKIVSHTPAFLGANPAIVKTEVGVGPKKGTRVLAQEEVLAFELVNSLDDKQRTAALIAEKAPRDLRGAGEAQPPNTEPEGLAAKRMTASQVKVLRALVESYLENMPTDVAYQRRNEIEKHGNDSIHFAWAGALEPGIGHYYRIQGPTFLVEFVNTQPDSLGNLANHIHSMWRNTAGDFGLSK